MRAQLPLAAPRAPPLYCTVFVGFGARVRLRSIVFVGQYLRSLAGGDGRGRPLLAAREKKKNSWLGFRLFFNLLQINLTWLRFIYASTSGRLHSEFVRLLFLQAHRETERFFAASGVQSAQFDRGQFHFRRGFPHSDQKQSWLFLRQQPYV
jgi:hypothetical protein